MSVEGLPRQSKTVTSGRWLGIVRGTAVAVLTLASAAAARWTDGPLLVACLAISAIAAMALGALGRSHRPAGGAAAIPSALGERLKAAETFQALIEKDRLDQDRRMRERDNVVGSFDLSSRATLEMLHQTMRRMEEAVASLLSGAANASTRTEMVNGAVVEVAGSGAAVARAADELADSVQEVSQQVADTTSITEEAVATVETTNRIFGDLSVAATQIGEIVGLITGIADQTNLLALNATIEAARAGAAGKGFAVVASEVKALASQTSKATTDISQRIVAIQNSTRDATNAVTGIGQAVGRVRAVVGTIASAIEEQNVATHQIAMSSSRTAAANEAVRTNVARLADVSTTTHSLAEALQGAARDLGASTTSMRAEVGAFLEEMQVANISASFVLEAARLAGPAAAIRAEAALKRRTGRSLADLKSGDWVSTAVFDSFVQEFVAAKGGDGLTIRDLGRETYRALHAAGAFGKPKPTVLDWVLSEGDTFLQTHRGNEVRPRNFLNRRPGAVIVEAVAPGYEGEFYVGVYEAILELAGAAEPRVERKPGGLFEITWKVAA